jgi:nitroimidazol reductase NimA-like FMN-containing flavoprotein (pyridoxamine 5'-phosphate oxidase superfamily)
MKSTNVNMYGTELIPWSRVLKQLEAGKSNGSIWLATTRPDGRPHVTGVGAVWDGGKFYVVSGPGTRKSKNLAENPNCVIALSLPGIDVVLEGTAAIVRDEATLSRLAERYRAEGWPAEAKDGALTAPYSAPTAGPGPWDLYEVAVAKVLGITTAEPHGATRWVL